MSRPPITYLCPTRSCWWLVADPELLEEQNWYDVCQLGKLKTLVFCLCFFSHIQSKTSLIYPFLSLLFRYHIIFESLFLEITRNKPLLRYLLCVVSFFWWWWSHCFCGFSRSYLGWFGWSGRWVDGIDVHRWKFFGGIEATSTWVPSVRLNTSPPEIQWLKEETSS